MPLWIAGIPLDAAVELGFEVQPPPQIEGIDPIDWDEWEWAIVAESEEDLVIGLFLPAVPPGYTGALPLTVTIPSQGEFQFRAWMNPPFFNSLPSQETVNCFKAILNTTLGLADLVLPVGCIDKLTKRYFDNWYALAHRPLLERRIAYVADQFLSRLDDPLQFFSVLL